MVVGADEGAHGGEVLYEEVFLDGGFLAEPFSQGVDACGRCGCGVLVGDDAESCRCKHEVELWDESVGGAQGYGGIESGLVFFVE